MKGKNGEIIFGESPWIMDIIICDIHLWYVYVYTVVQYCRVIWTVEIVDIHIGVDILIHDNRMRNSLDNIAVGCIIYQNILHCDEIIIDNIKQSYTVDV